jgi:hypothetical protein
LQSFLVEKHPLDLSTEEKRRYAADYA